LRRIKTGRESHQRRPEGRRSRQLARAAGSRSEHLAFRTGKQIERHKVLDHERPRFALQFGDLFDLPNVSFQIRPSAGPRLVDKQQRAASEAGSGSGMLTSGMPLDRLE